MTRLARQQLVFAVAVVGIVVVLPMVFGFLSGTRTRYCPFRHQVSDTAACVVLDKQGDTLLLQHADLDTNVYYLEIRTGRSSSEFDIPDSISRLWPAYTAKLIPGKTSSVLLNGVQTNLRRREPAG